ncbi:hypothetical protein N0V88_000845 [Collariella sp. IMI 366227]|nr:hypothetical protein N0V88_000845 [Collariella sp. IMI 366227]
MFNSGSKSHKHLSAQAATKHSKTSKAKTSPGGTPGGRGSFLFVVNELQLNVNAIPSTDQWLNLVPPVQPTDYVGEIPGTVFRYQNGVVSPALGYVWYRPVPGQRGHITRAYLSQETGFTVTGFPADYKSHTVFACSPLLPMVVTDGDASLGNSFVRKLCTVELLLTFQSLARVPVACSSMFA